MNLDEALPGFIAESADLLRDMEAALLECTTGPRNSRDHQSHLPQCSYDQGVRRLVRAG